MTDAGYRSPISKSIDILRVYLLDCLVHLSGYSWTVTSRPDKTDGLAFYYICKNEETGISITTNHLRLAPAKDIFRVIGRETSAVIALHDRALADAQARAKGATT